MGLTIYNKLSAKVDEDNTTNLQPNTNSDIIKVVYMIGIHWLKQYFGNNMTNMCSTCIRLFTLGLELVNSTNAKQTLYVVWPLVL